MIARRTPLKRSASPHRGGKSQAGKPGVKVMPDGREVCNQYTSRGRTAYRERTRAMYNRQNGLCCICKEPMPFFDITFEHQDGRGMNGSRRDDRIEKDGKPYNGAAHGTCNVKKGSRKVDYHASPFHEESDASLNLVQQVRKVDAMAHPRRQTSLVHPLLRQAEEPCGEER